LQRICGKQQDFILGEKPLKTLRLDQESRKILVQDFWKLPRQNSSMYRGWENWLKGGNPHLNITFESECAMQHPQATFIMPLHPLVKQAALSFDVNQRVAARLKIKTDDILPEVMSSLYISGGFTASERTRHSRRLPVMMP
jgi:hypothetical protein